MIVYVNITRTLHYRMISFLWYLYFILFCLILFNFSMEIGKKKWPSSKILATFCDSVSMAPLQSSNGGEIHATSLFFLQMVHWMNSHVFFFYLDPLFRPGRGVLFGRIRSRHMWGQGGAGRGGGRRKRTNFSISFAPPVATRDWFWFWFVQINKAPCFVQTGDPFPSKHKWCPWCKYMCFFVQRTEDVCFSPSVSLFNSMSSLQSMLKQVIQNLTLQGSYLTAGEIKKKIHAGMTGPAWKSSLALSCREEGSSNIWNI